MAARGPSHKFKELSVARLMELIAADGKYLKRPSARSSECFRNTKKPKRKPGEQVGDFVQRRPNSYETLVDLTGNHTIASEDLRTFFLMDMCGLTDEQRKRILDQASKECLG